MNLCKHGLLIYEQSDRRYGSMSVLILEDNRQILNVLEKLVLSVAEDVKSLCYG